jgi:hypothetical protein
MGVVSGQHCGLVRCFASKPLRARHGVELTVEYRWRELASWSVHDPCGMPARADETGGEIDIMEGINQQATNQIALHSVGTG